MKKERIKGILLTAVSVACLSFLSSCINDDDTETYDAVAQFEEEQQNIADYLSQNGLVAQTDTIYGLRYIINTEGTGESPIGTDSVNVSYAGYVLGSTSAFDDADSVVFQLDDLIAGWQILLPYLNEGGSMTMFIPSYYAYGTYTVGTISANSTLIFDVTLNGIVEDDE